MGWARAIPAGTRPEATAPATAPRKKGVMTDEAAKVAPNSRSRVTPVTAFRKAKPAPRRITPTATRVRGTERLEAMAAKAAGKPGHSTTSTKISHTGLASHTGPMAG